MSTPGWWVSAWPDHSPLSAEELSYKTSMFLPPRTSAKENLQKILKYFLEIITGSRVVRLKVLEDLSQRLKFIPSLENPDT